MLNFPISVESLHLCDKLVLLIIMSAGVQDLEQFLEHGIFICLVFVVERQTMLLEQACHPSLPFILLQLLMKLIKSVILFYHGLFVLLRKLIRCLSLA